MHTLKADEALQEQMIRQALLEPASVSGPLVTASVAPQPVPLWLHPEPPVQQLAKAAGSDDDDDEAADQHSKQLDTDKRRRGERVDTPDGRDGLLAFRLESLFTRAEYVAVDRTTEENEDEDAQSALEDMDVVSVARDRKRIAARLRFDLDLPPEDNDDICLGEGVPLPEWDYRQQLLQPDHCRLQPMQARDAGPRITRSPAGQGAPFAPPVRSHQTASHWLNGQADGSELDLSAVIDHTADRLRGVRQADARLYRNFRNAERDMSCLLLADLSLSTDAYVNNEQRVIDVVRDSLFLFSEALQATGDRFAMYGFPPGGAIMCASTP